MSVEKKQEEETLREVNYFSDGSELTQELKPKSKKQRPDTPFLYLSIILVQMIILVNGFVIVWTSPIIPILKSNDTTINPLSKPATTVDISMIAGLPILSGIIGTLLLPKFTDILGRKVCLQMIGFFIFLSCILLAFSKSVTMIIFSRCLGNIVLAGATAVIPIYITEICEDHNRAKFGCFLGIFHQFGHLFTFIVAPLISYRSFSLLMAFPLIPFLIFFFFVPESPVHLLSKGKREDCLTALRKLRSNKTEEEITSNIEQLEEAVKIKNTKVKPSLCAFFKTKEVRVGFMLASLPLLVQHMSGVAVIMTYLAPLFNSAGTNFSGNKLAIIVGCIKLSTFTFTSFVVEKVGRKRMLLISAASTGVPLFGLGCFFYLKHIGSPLIESLQWLPLTCTLCNVFMYSIGLGPIPNAIVHEMFPSEYRALASIIISTTIGLIISVLTTSFPIIEALIGIHWSLFMFSCSCFVGFILIYVFLPETKGRSLKEIQEILKNY